MLPPMVQWWTVSVYGVCSERADVRNSQFSRPLERGGAGLVLCRKDRRVSITPLSAPLEQNGQLGKKKLPQVLLYFYQLNHCNHSTLQEGTADCFEVAVGFDQ